MTPIFEPSSTSVVAPNQLIELYISGEGPEVFSGVVHATQIWTVDQYDVVDVHSQARSVFERLLNRASAKTEPTHGKCWLIKGAGGAGKTHLMRAFRKSTHDSKRGYCAYLQMTTGLDDYTRYLLSYVIDSLEHPYSDGDPTTGLMRLANGLLDALGDMIDVTERAKLRDDFLEPQDITKLVFRFSEIAVQNPRFAKIDQHVIRAILFLVSTDGRIRPKVLNWLRCEELPAVDRETIGGLPARTTPDAPLKMVISLGQLMYAVHNAALVVMVDQMEEILDEKSADALSNGAPFRNAVNTLISLCDGLTTAIVVMGTHAQFYDWFGRKALPNPKLERLEVDPSPMVLNEQRTVQEISAIVSRRLKILFDDLGYVTHDTDSYAPFELKHLQPLQGSTTRGVLTHFHKHREACINAGKWIEPATIIDDGTGGGGVKSVPKFGQLWNDEKGSPNAPQLQDAEFAQLLAWAIQDTSHEMHNGLIFSADPVSRFIEVGIQQGNAIDKLLVAICEKNAVGGGLKKQIDEVQKRVGELPAVLVRFSDFPGGTTSVIAKAIAKICVPVGRHRREVISDSDWRAMKKFREFCRVHGTAVGFAQWRKDARVLAGLSSLRGILQLQKLETVQATVPVSPANPPLPPVGVARVIAAPKATIVPPSVPVAVSPSGSIRIGQTRSAAPVPVQLDMASLCRHAAFLGGSGSGKTTAALTILEELLQLGIPVVMLDRKGDLSQYADPMAGLSANTTPEQAARLTRFRELVDVALFTPNNPNGRNLAISVYPSGTKNEKPTDRQLAAQLATASLAKMLGSKSQSNDPKLVILQTAIEQLSAYSDEKITLERLQAYIAEQDDSLMSVLGSAYEEKFYKQLAQTLFTVAKKFKNLFEANESVDLDLLLGRGQHAVPGKTRLSIINTQFLGDDQTVEFWVAQFLLVVDRWRAKQSAAAGQLQAVFLFDEADKYLPAMSKPATKEPMEGLLKRGRSAGLSIFLATQSPGDLDYKCRDQVLTWFLGRVKEQVAVNKLKPMLESKPGLEDKLPDQKTGEFLLVREADVLQIQTDRNLVPTAQLSEEQILALASAGRPAAIY